MVGLGLPEVNGRVDLRGLKAPTAASIPRGLKGSQIAIVESLGSIVLRDVCWSGLDLSDSTLNSLRFFDCCVDGCSFNGATCQDVRLWGTRIAGTSFRGSDLRRSALGGVEGLKRNVFDRVDFTNADLRKTAYLSAEMLECTFASTNLSKVDFQGTVFKNCVFEGELEEVIFYRRGFRGDAFPCNEMKGVDFRRAKFRYVEFRDLDMADVIWPDDTDAVLLEDYPAVLDKMLQRLSSRSDGPARRLTAVIGTMRKWAGRNQQRGVLSKRELIELSSEREVSDLLALCS